MNAKTSLKHRGNRFANPAEQLMRLEDGSIGVPFSNRLDQQGELPLKPHAIEILQLNLGKLCNMTCQHCHVDAGPDRREIMRESEIEAAIRVLENNVELRTVDLTGGAPEMNPRFRQLVIAARQLGRHVIDRCNLTILLANGFRDLPEFLAENRVEVVASLPCYLEENTDSQRGDGAYSSSIKALRVLNQLGYGKPESDLTLTLVYNPVGPTLPPNQKNLEADYRKYLEDMYGIQFTRLFTITNMPVSRYLEYLVRIGEYEKYIQLLMDAFNPTSVDGLMCRNTISVSWDGRLFDCDFNQMLELEIDSGEPMTLQNFDYKKLSQRQITLGQHCYGCTAGSGSGCQGSIA